MPTITLSQNVHFNNATKTIVFTDSTDYTSYSGISGSVTITDPLGNVYSSAISDSSPTYTISSPTLDSNSKFILGVWTVAHTMTLGATSGTSNYTLNLVYVRPTIDLSMTVNCVTPLITSTDDTVYNISGVQPSSSSFSHTLTYPVSTGEAAYTVATQNLQTSTVYTLSTEALQYTAALTPTLNYTFTNHTVYDSWTDYEHLDVYCDNNLCNVYCCVRSLRTKYYNELCNKGREAVEPIAKQLYEVGFNMQMLKAALECGKNSDVSAYTAKINEIANCSSDCGCDDGTPQLVTGLGATIADSGGGQTVVVQTGGSPIIVSSAVVGSTTTYSVSLDPSYDAGDVPIADAGGYFSGTDVEAALQEVGAETADSYTLLGVTKGATTLGTFTGTTIIDSSSVKVALQALETALEAISAIASVDLAYTASPTNGVVTNTEGTNATITAADGTNAGLMVPAQFTKLSYITVTQAVNLDTMESDITDHESEINDLITLTGLSANSTDFGTFSGSTITDGTTLKTILQQLETAVEAAGGTANLSYTASATNGVVASDTGTDATITLATTTLAGLMSPAQYDKLSYITVSSAVNLKTIDDEVGFLRTLSGTGSGTDDLGSFTGSTITSNTTIKNALQELETAFEAFSVSSGTNLTYTASATDGTVVSSTGSNATLPLADSSNAGLLKPADFDKLSNISSTIAINLDEIANRTYITLTDAATVSWDMDNGYNAQVTLAGNRALSISNVSNGFYGTIKVTQDGTGTRTLSLPANSKVIDGGAGAISLSTAPGATDILTFTYDGTYFWWNYGLNYTS